MKFQGANLNYKYVIDLDANNRFGLKNDNFDVVAKKYMIKFLKYISMIFVIIKIASGMMHVNIYENFGLIRCRIIAN